MVGVPVTRPVAASMDRPAGRPVADHEAMVASASVAVAAIGLIAVPEASERAPRLVTDTGPVTVQVKLAAPMAPELSVALRPTR